MSFPDFFDLLKTDIPDGIGYLVIAVVGVAGGLAHVALFALFF